MTILEDSDLIYIFSKVTAKSSYKKKLGFYTITMNLLKKKLGKLSHLQYPQKTKKEITAKT
jgi:hypothetical protein